MTYEYKMSGLDYVVLTSGYERDETPYGSGVSISDAEALDRTIAIIISTSPYRICGQDVRFLRAVMDMSQKELADHLGAQRVTVARWEAKPHTPIPGPADRMIRIILAHELDIPHAIAAICENLTEIADKRPGPLYMGHEPVKAPPAQNDPWRLERRYG